MDDRAPGTFFQTKNDREGTLKGRVESTTRPECRKMTRSLLQRFRRRLNFAIQYIEARRRSKSIAKLLPILQSSFNHPWVADVEIRLRFWPNNETRLGQLWRKYKSMPQQFMNWDAPIAISVFRERRGKKKQTLCMSIYLMKDVLLYIGQIQGIAGTDAPKELREWPKIFIDFFKAFLTHKRSAPKPAEALHITHWGAVVWIHQPRLRRFDFPRRRGHHHALRELVDNSVF
jgi:hypothetical protein